MKGIVITPSAVRTTGGIIKPESVNPAFANFLDCYKQV